MRRIMLVLLLVVIALSVEGVGYLMRADAPSGTAASSVNAATPKTIVTPDISGGKPAVFCQSIVMVTLPEKRWRAYIKHPNGSKEALEASMRRLPQDEVPATLPVEDLVNNYTILDQICFERWSQIFDLTNSLYVGRARSMLEDPYVITERDMRAVVLKIYFDDAAEIAESMFPLQGEVNP